MVIGVIGDTFVRAYHAIRIIRAQVIDTRISGIDIEQVGHHRSGTQPRLTADVLLVPSVAHRFLRLIGILIDEMARGIHIPERIGIEVGIEIMRFEALIRYLVIVLGDTGLECGQDSRRRLLSAHAVIVTVRNGGNSFDDVSECDLRHEKRKHNRYLRFEIGHWIFILRVDLGG